MNVRDEWGSDPSVQIMRRVFSRMEETYRTMLEKSEISFFDERLGPIREAARDMFERTWHRNAGRGLGQVEEEAARLYLRCLTRCLVTAGIEVAEDCLPDDEELLPPVREGMP